MTAPAALYALSTPVFVVCDVVGDESRPPCYVEQYEKPYEVHEGEVVAVRLKAAYPYTLDVEDMGYVCEVFAEKQFVTKTRKAAVAAAEAGKDAMRLRLLAQCLPMVLAWACLAMSAEDAVICLEDLPRRNPLLETALSLAGAKGLGDWERASKAYWKASHGYSRASVLREAGVTLKAMARNHGCKNVRSLWKALPEDMRSPGLAQLLDVVCSVLHNLNQSLGYSHD